MVEPDAQQLDAVFHALANRTRREMLHSLAGESRTVGELAAPFRMSFAAASKHVKVLERAGLVQRRIEGRNHICRLNAEALAEAYRWIRYYERFWTERLDALEAVLRAEDAQARSNDHRR